MVSFNVVPMPTTRGPPTIHVVSSESEEPIVANEVILRDDCRRTASLTDKGESTAIHPETDSPDARLVHPMAVTSRLVAPPSILSPLPIRRKSPIEAEFPSSTMPDTERDPSTAASPHACVVMPTRADPLTDRSPDICPAPLDETVLSTVGPSAVVAPASLADSRTDRQLPNRTLSDTDKMLASLVSE